MTFFIFYIFQGLTYVLFKIKSRQIAFLTWAFNSMVVLPGMLALNVWGNMLVEKMDKTTDCTYNGWA